MEKPLPAPPLTSVLLPTLNVVTVPTIVHLHIRRLTEITSIAQDDLCALCPLTVVFLLQYLMSLPVVASLNFVAIPTQHTPVLVQVLQCTPPTSLHRELCGDDVGGISESSVYSLDTSYMYSHSSKMYGMCVPVACIRKLPTQNSWS